jgi:hypothetical protein
MFGYVPQPTAGQFEQVRAYLQPSLDRFGSTWDECRDLINSGHAQLWMSNEAALVTCVDGKIVEIWLVGGRVVNASDQYLATIEKAARQAGFTGMRLTGRKGWARLLAKWGWVQRGEDVIKELQNG